MMKATGLSQDLGAWAFVLIEVCLDRVGFFHPKVVKGSRM